MSVGNGTDAKKRVSECEVVWMDVNDYRNGLMVPRKMKGQSKCLYIHSTLHSLRFPTHAQRRKADKDRARIWRSVPTRGPAGGRPEYGKGMVRCTLRTVEYNRVP